MSQIRTDAAQALRRQAENLAGIRQCSIVEATQAVAASMAYALSSARGTRDEPYWRLMVDVADEQVASELSAREMSR